MKYMELFKDELLAIYENCIKGRFLDERIQEIYYQNQKGVFFSSIGSELGPASITTLLKKEDYLVPRYRGFAAVIGKGIQIEAIIGELFRKKTGTTKGIGDVSSYRNPNYGVPGYSTILGVSFSIALGLALSSKIKREKRIVTVFFGDGESTRSTFGSALNLASLWNLPIFFVCENNKISSSVPIEKISATETIAQRAKGYNLDGETIPEITPILLIKRVKEIIHNIREKQRPFLLEIMQTRFTSHFFGLGEKPLYGKNLPQNQDPLALFRRELLADQMTTEGELELLHQKVQKSVDQALMQKQAEKELSEEEFFSIYHE